MMRILIVTPLYPPEVGGPATYTKLLEEELPEYGFEVGVVKFADVRHLPKGLSHLAFFWKIFKLGKAYDLIYAQDPVSVGLPAVLAAKFLRRRLFLKIVGDFAWENFQNEKSKIKDEKQRLKIKNEEINFITPEEFQNNKYDWKTEMRKKIERWVARQAEKVIVPSHYLEGIIRQWGIEPDKIRVIYNAFEPVEIKATKEEIRRFLELEGTILISAGRLVSWKGFDTLIETMPMLARQFGDIKLLIAGEGPLELTLKSKITNSKLQKKVKLLGPLTRENLLRYIKAADIFVLASGYEGFSHQLLEAMSVGTPIVTTDAGGNPELVQDGREGLLVPYQGREALVVAISQLFKDRRWAELLAWNAKYKAREFSKERMIKNLIQELQ